MQSGAIVHDDEEVTRWSESLCRACLDAIESTVPPAPTAAEQATAAELFLEQIRTEVLTAEAAGDLERLRALGPFLDDLALDFPIPVPDDLRALAARYRPTGT